MKIRRWLLDQSSKALLFLFRMLGVHAHMRLKMSRGESGMPAVLYRGEADRSDG